MKNKGLLLILVLLGLVLGALPALAGTVSLSETHNFSVTVNPISLGADPGQVSAAASGQAGYPYEAPDPAYAVVADPSVTATLVSGPLLTTTQATTTYLNGFPSTAYTAQQTQTGNAGSDFGFLYQATSNGFKLLIEAASAGLYTVTLSDSFDVAYQLSNSGFNYFHYLSANTDVTATLTSGADQSNFSGSGPTSIFADSRGDVSLPDRLADFVISQSNVNPGDIILSLTTTGADLLELNVSLDTYYDGNAAAVPFPSTLLLAGSGLGSILLARRRFFRA